MFRHLLFVFFFLAATLAPCFAAEPAGPGKALTREEALEVLTQYQPLGQDFVNESLSYSSAFLSIIKSNRLGPNDYYYVSLFWNASNLFAHLASNFYDCTRNYYADICSLDSPDGILSLDDTLSSVYKDTIENGINNSKVYLDKITDNESRAMAKSYNDILIRYASQMNSTYLKLKTAPEGTVFPPRGSLSTAMLEIRWKADIKLNAVYEGFLSLSRNKDYTDFDGSVLSAYAMMLIVSYVMELDGLYYLYAALDTVEKFPEKMPNALSREQIISIVNKRNECVQGVSSTIITLCKKTPPPQMDALYQKL